MKISHEQFHDLWLKFCKGELTQKEMFEKTKCINMQSLLRTSNALRNRYGERKYPKLDYGVIPENKTIISFWNNRHGLSMAEREIEAKKLGFREYRALSVYIARLRCTNNVDIPKTLKRGYSLREQYGSFVDKVEISQQTTVLHRDFVGWLKDRGLIESGFVACG